MQTPVAVEKGTKAYCSLCDRKFDMLSHDTSEFRIASVGEDFDAHVRDKHPDATFRAPEVGVIVTVVPKRGAPLQGSSVKEDFLPLPKRRVHRVDESKKTVFLSTLDGSITDDAAVPWQFLAYSS